jgi:hypothetical protein
LANQNDKICKIKWREMSLNKIKKLELKTENWS